MCTLARLSFWVPPERMDTFEATYKKKLVPILKKHDLEESSERGRKTVDGVFSRLFEVESPVRLIAERKALHKDPAWQEVLRDLSIAFRTGPRDRLLSNDLDISRPEGLLLNHLGIYRTPTGPVKTVEAGSGCRQGLWQSFGVQDGLHSSNILKVLQDREGNLWFGSDGAGVCRYDGVEFAVFTTQNGLVSDWVRSILEDREGNLWFGAWGGGVSRYDPSASSGGTGEAFVTFTTEDGLAGDRVWCISEDSEGHLWLGTEGGGVSKYDGKEFVALTTKDGLADDQVWCIFEDREGDVWIGTNQGGVSQYNGKGFVTFTTEDGLAGNRVRCISEDSEGHLWFGTEGGGVSRYDPSASSGGTGEAFVTFTTEDGLAGDRVWCISEDSEGHLWLGTEGGGASKYDGKEFVTFTTEDGLTHNNVKSILEDDGGRLWFGTAGGGISRYDRVQLTTFTAEDGLVGGGARSILEDSEGNLWIGTWESVSRYDGEEFRTFTAEDGFPADMVVDCIVEDRAGHLWFGTGGGVIHYDGEKFSTLTTEDGLANNPVLSMLEDREGHLWFGIRRRGVRYYNGESFVKFWPPRANSSDDDDGFLRTRAFLMYPLLEDRNENLWFGFWMVGVIRYDPSASSGGTGKELVTFTIDDGLAGNIVNCGCEDHKGHFWFGTKGGVSRYDGKEFVTFTTEDGLTCNEVSYILEDRDGYIWFGTDGGGVSRYDRLVFQSLSTKDGLVHDTVYGILQDRKGEFWIATEGGVTRYRPQHTPPTVYIKEVIADQRYEPNHEIHLPASQKLVTLAFQGRSFTTRPDGMAYVYRLKGYDSDWQVTYTNRVEYHDLPLGAYTFQVRAVDRDLNYSEPATVHITVEPDPRLRAFAEALSGTSEEFVGDSQALHRVEEQLVDVAPTDLTVLILGETGTGKGLAARTVHGLSARRASPFVPVNCGAIPEGLVESELFGHERGAFTGAVSRKVGKIELAEGGTLFLDEIGDLSPEAQAKLLQFLEERTFERVGGTETLQVDVRVIAATNRDLRGMVEVGTFRKDLYFRLQEFVVELPPLRERREDIPELCSYFLERSAAHVDKEVTHLSPEALSMLQTYAWPGNVRELEHVIRRAVTVCSGSVIGTEDILLDFESLEGESTEEWLSLEEVERRHIQKALEQTGWVIGGSRGAAALLGLPRSTLQDRMKKLGIVRPLKA